MSGAGKGLAVGLLVALAAGATMMVLYRGQMADSPETEGTAPPEAVPPPPAPVPPSVEPDTAVQELQQQLSEAEARAQRLEQKLAAAQPGGSPSEDVAVPGSEEEAQEDPEKDAAEARQKRIMSQQIRMITDMAYQAYYGEMQLEPEAKAEVQDLLLESALQERKVVEEALRSKDTTAAQVKVRQDEITALLKEQLSGVLDDGQLAAFEAYEPYAEQILYETLLDGQLTMLAPGLDSDSRGAVKEVFAEELVVAIEDFESSEEIYTLDNFNQAQMRALTAGLDRLGGDLSADQLAQAQGFVRQAELMFQAMEENDGGP